MRDIGNGKISEKCRKPWPDSNGKTYLGTCIYEKPADWIDPKEADGIAGMFFVITMLFAMAVFGVYCCTEKDAL